ncbi:MAG: beta-galactosidase [Bacteroidaceae bacterium]|nr:beta-galactosidase [Bacteroidaceae bacterium]
MKKLFLLFALLSQTLCAQTTFKFGTATTPDGHTFEVDSRGFIIDKKPVIPVMGEIHYARVPQQDWRREIRKMKAGGITVVATYVFWIHHEPEEGRWDWSGNRNLRRFIEICGEEGMPVVLRVGPFCHGEVYQGGFPTWMVQKSIDDPKQYKLRSTAPGFLAATTILYNNIFAQVNGLQWKDGGPIVGMQLENECRGPWAYFTALKQIANKAGFDLPFYTRTGWPKLNGKEVFGEILPLYGDYADGFWDRSMKDMPGDYPKAFIMKDTRLSAVIATESLGANQSTEMERSDLSYPYFTCELGGGMMPAYHRRINISGKEIKPLAICKLGSGSNLPGYYMYHGGTNPYNPRHTMGETQATSVTNYNDMPYMSYDFQCPLGEMGQPLDEAFHSTRLLHQMLADWGDQLSQMDVDTLSEHYSRRGAFEFYNDYVRILNEEGQSYCTLRGLKVGAATIDWTTVEPFCQADGTIYFVEIPGKKPQLSINNKVYKAKPGKPFTAAGQTFCVLSREKAYTAFKIDGQLHYAQRGGILYKAGNTIVEEYWQTTPTSIQPTQTQAAAAPRAVQLGSQKVAAMPTNADFDKAAIYQLEDLESLANLEKLEGLEKLERLANLEKLEGLDNLERLERLDNPESYLKISYKGDAARIYADGQLIEDNFWNGKPMLVRLSDLIGKRVELRILPLSKDYPIYFQAPQRAQLDKAPGGLLLSLDSIELLTRNTLRVHREH